MLVIKDTLAINLNHCTDFYKEEDTNNIIFCMNMVSEYGTSSYWNEIEFASEKQRDLAFVKIINAYKDNERIVDL
jgi:hypothetical protein